MVPMQQSQLNPEQQYVLSQKNLSSHEHDFRPVTSDYYETIESDVEDPHNQHCQMGRCEKCCMYCEECCFKTTAGGLAVCNLMAPIIAPVAGVTGAGIFMTIIFLITCF